MAAEAGPTGRDAGGESPTVVSSPDGRSFRLRTSAEAGLRPGDYVTIADGSGAEHLGYVESVDEVTETTTWAAGSIMPGPITPAPFRSGSARRSDAAAVRRFFAASCAALPVGTLVDDPEVPVGLIPKRINRHTFWCGQSGSGKTYALGVALEQILLHTRLPMVIFDPNSDFVRLGETLPHVGPEVAGQLADRPVRVLRRGSGPDALRARLRSMDLASRGALRDSTRSSTGTSSTRWCTTSSIRRPTPSTTTSTRTPSRKRSWTPTIPGSGSRPAAGEPRPAGLGDLGS